MATVYHSTNSFTYNAATRTFASEASTLSYNGGLFCQIFNDSADEGFVMVSAKTGKEVKFAVDRTEYNADNDIVCWKLKPVELKGSDRLAMTNVTAVVFNT